MSKRGFKKIEVKRQAVIHLDSEDIDDLVELLDLARVRLNRNEWPRREEYADRLRGTLDQYFQELTE
jgi:hypothetical protein